MTEQRSETSDVAWGSSVVDAVLLAPPVRVPLEEVCEIATAAFGVTAATASDLGSERDQTVMLRDAGGEAVAVMKVSNPAEDAATLDMEALAARHARAADPALPVVLPRTAQRGGEGVGDHRVARARQGQRQWVRLYDVVPGRSRMDPRTLDDAALVAWGETTARLARAFRGFIHPRVIRVLPWDVQHALQCRPMLPAIDSPQARATVAAVLDRFESAVLPSWPLLRHQAVHADFTVDNALTDERGRVTGIVDLGDMSFTSLVADLASVLDSLGRGREGHEMFRTARLVLDGYQRVTPLEQLELSVLADLWATRAAVGVAIGSWRASQGLEDKAFAERFNETALSMIDTIRSTGWDRAAALVSGDRPGRGADQSRDPLAARRDSVLGPALEPLSYEMPIEMAAASGVWMTDAAGRRFLDMYNNVPCVGHSHPRVTGAVARQWRTLNTNLRYLHPGAIELAERLTATLPPSLDTVFFVNSGSEANDLAWRLATHASGHGGGLCTAHAYHGITAVIAPLSPETLPGGPSSTNVERWSPPDAYRGLHGDAVEFDSALERLQQKGIGLAATILDGVLQSDGVLDLDPAYVQQLVRRTHDAGGLWIADEVQGGHGRTGDAMWSFDRFGIEPDVVTLGKPMGNGQPVGAVITRRDIAERFARETVFFSTFGGNQVSMAAAHAVLDVLEDEQVLPRVRTAGEALRRAVREATSQDDRVGDVRGMGLAVGIELVRDGGSTSPDAQVAAAVKEALRERGVLVGTTGPSGNVLKVRPPLAFTADLVPLFVEALTHALADVVR
jgi:4-aminobutyrate aminotransferase-like enzyme/Ser/Thr protein kinase RdoA (MazF antagonist)